MSNLTPYAILLALAERSQQNQHEMPLQENARTHWNGLGFKLLGYRFVVPMSEVAEILTVPAATNIPNVKHFVLGIANVRGKLMAVIDLPAFFETSKNLPSERRRVLAVEEGDQYIGFVVDESLGMQHFPQDAFQDTIVVEEIFRPFIMGGYEVAGNLWPVLSLTALAADPNFEKLAAQDSFVRPSKNSADGGKSYS